MGENRLFKFGLIFLMVFFLFLTIFFFAEYSASAAEKISLPTVALPRSNSKVLIVAPHNDDEALGAALYILHALKKGAQVKVVIMTNGDGYPEAVKIYKRSLTARPADYIDFGYLRQEETLEAMGALGVKREDIIFLGYPDAGLSHLWAENFDVPYESKYTKVSTSPYKTNFTPGAVYTGRNLLADIEKLIGEYRPDYILYPHPNDQHPDHWGTYTFVRYALSKLDFHPESELLYLIHRGDWPFPMAFNTKLLVDPPDKLLALGGQWYRLNLTPFETSFKDYILQMYRTQLPALRNLMMAFVRRNELFYSYPDKQIPSSLHEDREIVPSEENLLVADPHQDSIRVDFSKDVDLTGIYGEISKEGNLNLFLKTDGDISASITYTLDLIFFMEDREERYLLRIQGGDLESTPFTEDRPEEIQIDRIKHALRVRMPLVALSDFRYLLIGASSSSPSGENDRTAYRRLRPKE